MNNGQFEVSQLLEELKAIQGVVDKNKEQKNFLSLTGQTLNSQSLDKAILLLEKIEELTKDFAESKNSAFIRIPEDDAIRMRKALVDDPQLKILTDAGILTTIAFDIASLTALLNNPSYTEIHAYPVLNKDNTGKIYISQCLAGWQSGAKGEDFNNLQDVFNPWPPRGAAKPPGTTLDDKI